MAKKKRGPGRPLKGLTPVRSHKQISFRLTPATEKAWQLIKRSNTPLSDTDIFAALVQKGRGYDITR